MHPFLEKLERFTDEAIPYALILLAGVIAIVISIGLWKYNKK